MDAKVLFLRSIDDLHESINARDDYEILRSAALIRQLFLDKGRSLFNLANRDARFRLVFRAIPPSAPPLRAVKTWFAVDSIDPRAAAGMPNAEKAKSLTRTQFFKTPIGAVGGADITVAELVRFAAHVLGGVHAGAARTDKDRVLREVAEFGGPEGLSPVLLQLRAIGRIVLEALRGMKYELMNLARFAGAPGLGVYMVLALHPPKPDTESFVIDVGISPERNRVSLYVDTRGDLTCRVFDNQGQRKLIRAGGADRAFAFGQPTSLWFEVAGAGAETVLLLEAGGWYYVETTEALKLSSQDLQFVLGSDVNGKAETHMTVMEWVVTSAFLAQDEKDKLMDYFRRQIAQGYRQGVLFRGNQFLHSENHPNFAQPND